MDWWMTFGNREPLGPLRTEELLRRIEANAVPIESLICQVGSTSWKPIAEVAPFSILLADRDGRRFDPEVERTPIEPVEPYELPADVSDAGRPTARYAMPISSEPPLREADGSFGDDDDRNTEVDATPLWEPVPVRRTRSVT